MKEKREGVIERDKNTSSLTKSVLILNRFWQPVNIVSVRRAFGLLFCNNAKVIHNCSDNYRIIDGEMWLQESMQNINQDESEWVSTPNCRIRIPKILLLKEYSQIPAREPKLTRENIFRRDGHRCQYTGKVYSPDCLNIDHVIPKAYGGKSTWENLVTSSIKANQKKANRLPHEAGLKLIRKPVRPKWRVFTIDLAVETIDSAWRFFIPS